LRIMKIDAYSHIVPPKYKEALYKKAPSIPYVDKFVQAFPALTDLDIRFRTMDKYEGLVQVLTLSGAPLEDIVNPKDAVELARIANDELAELVAKYPDRFATAVACLPMNDVDAALKEVDRAITELRLRGVQIFTEVSGKPLDSPEFMPLYEKMAYYNLPILIHPPASRRAPGKDYSSPSESRHLAYLIFGWPYETSVAMTNLIFGAGVFEKYPNIKILTHHCGAMVPYFAERIAAANDSREMRMGFRHEQHLTQRPLDYYHMFYGDTALMGNVPALMCGYAFFGADHILFGTDTPIDSQLGDRLIRQTLLSVEQMDITDIEKKKIFEDNARKLFRLPI
jgi:aminocarboxymuconate-semialdehyde decarboxylase